jgi:Uma2 family endonuclease
MNEIMDVMDVFPTLITGETTPFERLYSFEAYLEMEETSLEKHEFDNGKLITMAGGTKIHNDLCGRVITGLNNCLDDSDEEYSVCTSDMKVRIIAKNKAVYPDVTVIEGEPIYYLGDPKVVVNPLLIVEVLSPSTERYDRGKKFDYYRTLESFREYVLVSQDEPKVEVFFLEDPEKELWKISTYEGLDAIVDLHSIDCQMTMKKIYHRVFKTGVTI